MTFVDRAEIEVQAGSGGDGALAFRREKGVPRGGPAGGDGGRGGDVVLVADSNLDTLLDYRYRSVYRAGRGGNGGGSRRTGADGDELVLPVPPGTVAVDATSGRRLGELLEEGDRVVVALGGRGGRGNAAFATATRQAPRRHEDGEPGESLRVVLELKLIADVGLVGQPNAGKSTLLSRVSAARPRVAAYPFTTLQPGLGVVGLSGERSFVMADIPGLIEGAHEGRGLGTRFLRHVERTRTLALMVPVDDPDPAATYGLLRSELRGHDVALTRLPHCVVLSKADLLASGEEAPAIEAPDAWGIFTVSAVTGRGLDRLAEALWERVREEKERARARRGEEPFPELEEWTP
ncbi:MAG: GTPase ObgE [Candidatus Palauibacterales bacterium]|nr:GTPase ObgE [Candidatus Palauibacterales bacterium]MDP2529817.1 GTPase ObgE [Candidatus Palauibacterales bacterium]MDP2582856.1 GTPase ObgE [Candidatus Palauibacterales bacterium]